MSLKDTKSDDVSALQVRVCTNVMDDSDILMIPHFETVSSKKV